LADFLSRVSSLADAALSQNETLDIFQDELAVLADAEDAAAGGGGGGASSSVLLGAADAKHLREERQFMDLELSNNRALSAIQWHPRAPAWLATAVAPRLSLEQRVAEAGMPRTSHILVYTLGEFACQMVSSIKPYCQRNWLCDVGCYFALRC
jgi:hypothetical protein